jgi:glycosyltransferase involved in cell wall biosynthesis
MPTVSVIIPNYNHARFLRQRIESVMGQTYQDFEVILLDDGSSQGSPTPPVFPVSVDSKNP